MAWPLPKRFVMHFNEMQRVPLKSLVFISHCPIYQNTWFNYEHKPTNRLFWEALVPRLYPGSWSQQMALLWIIWATAGNSCRPANPSRSVTAPTSWELAPSSMENPPHDMSSAFLTLARRKGLHSPTLKLM